MASLAEIYRKEKSTGGTLSSAIGKKVLESIDPRQIFDRGGIFATMFPALKSYRAIPEKLTAQKTTPDGNVASLSTDLLQDISLTSKINAKNSIALPAMARDMNVMRQNIIKLVKLQGGIATNRADAFFLKARERETALENALSRTTSTRFTGFTEKKLRDGQSKQTALFVEGSEGGGFTEGVIGGLASRFFTGAALRSLGTALLGFLTSPAFILPLLTGGLIALIVESLKKSKTIEDYRKELSPEQQKELLPAAARNYPMTPGENVAPRPTDPKNWKAQQVWDSKYASGWNPDGTPKKKTQEQPTAPAATTGPSPSSAPVATTSQSPSKVTKGGYGGYYMGIRGEIAGGDTDLGSAIGEAASKTGVPLDTLAIFGQIESGLGKFVENKLSSARGPFQFIESTWLETFRKHGPKYGYDVANMDKEEQLDYRYNNRAASLMAAELLKDNAKVLQIDPADPKNVDELYLAHFLGPNGARNVLSGKGLSEKQKESILKYNPNLQTASSEELKNFALAKTETAAKTKAVQQITSPQRGTILASASTAVSEGQRASMGGSVGNVMVDASNKTTVAATNPTKPSSTYDTALVQTLIGIAA